MSERTLEQALSKTEADADATLKTANAVVSSLRRFRAAAKVGNLKEIRSSVDSAEKALATLRQHFANAREGWNIDEGQYFADGFYAKELIAAGQQAGISIFERDDCLYCYPAFIRVSPNDRAVLIDKKREPRVRPSVLAARLKELQTKPPSFKPDAFLEALWKAYSKAVEKRGKELIKLAPVVLLVEIYEMLTLLPGVAKEYPTQEFIRDIYLLHRSGVDTTRSGAKVSFPSSTGLKSGRAKVLAVIDETGEEKRYYGICFTNSPKE